MLSGRVAGFALVGVLEVFRRGVALAFRRGLALVFATFLRRGGAVFVLPFVFVGAVALALALACLGIGGVPSQ